ncbi:hypothetical protein [Deferribacter abyssi]|uniref:hypothetical protein n=1 Tax=Deferribacter abyssi TaxID=213806 RepID=UPI003C24DB1C
MKQGIKIINFKEMYEFLVFLLVKAYPEIHKDKIIDELNDYTIIGICNCISNENTYLYDNICGSFYLKSLSDKKGVFESDDWVLFNSNIGLFIFHTNEKGHLKECEFFYRAEYYPVFFLDIVKKFTSKSYFNIFLKCLDYNNVKYRNLDYLKNEFRVSDINVIDVE